jgi:Zn-dependent M28 family amino/carboxypeptidase
MDDIRATLDRALGATWRDDQPWAFLTRLTELDRFAGHPGEREAASLVADALRDAGARAVTTDPFDLQVWTRGETDLAVTGPVERSFEGIALPYSPPGDVSAPLVDVGHGTPEEIDAADVAGAVALASTDSPDGGRIIHRMEKFGHALEAGARGFVFHNQKPGRLPPTGALRFGGEAAAPGVGVSRETGEWLVDYAARDADVHLRVEATTEPGASVNAHGVFGPAEAADEVLVVAHHDAHDIAEGALDNGCGVATLLTAARTLAPVADALDRRVRFASLGAEEVGLVGAQALADTLDPRDIAAVLNLDGAGRYRTLRGFTHGSDAVADRLDALAERTDRDVAVETAIHPFSDHWPFLCRGVPAIQLHSVTPERGRGWGHTHADTRDKADGRNIREHGMLAALLVADLAGLDAPPADLPRPDANDLAVTLSDHGVEAGMRAANIWPAAWD